MRNQYFLFVTAFCLVSIFFTGCFFQNQSKKEDNKSQASLMEKQEKTESTIQKNNLIANYSTEDELASLLDYDSYNVDDTDATKVTFTATVVARDFKILELKFDEKSENIENGFVVEEIYGIERLNPNRPFIAGLHFIGLIPNNGISYVDEAGKKRIFMLYQSGEDGSLIMQEMVQEGSGS